MGKKPTNGVSFGRQAGIEVAYFFLRGFAFFFVISSRVLTGMASMRRASSSIDIGGVSSCLRLVGVMGVSRG